MNNQENWRAVYLNGEWVPVPCCAKCSSLDCNAVIDRSCGLEISYHDSCSALELIDKSFNYNENKYKHKIENPDEIKSNCPLPLWKRVRKYTADEKPLLSLKVQIQFFEIFDGKREELTDIGWYGGPGNYCWDTSSSGQLRDRDIVFWRHIL